MIRFFIALLGVVLAAVQPVAATEPRNFILHGSPKALPEVQFKDEEAHLHSLAEFRGKVVLLNIWATWGAPCREEMPTLERLQMQLGGPNFNVVTLSVDRGGSAPVKAFFTATGIKHLDLYIYTSTKALQELSVIGLPTTLLIDRDGRELGRLVGPAEWDAPDTIAFIKHLIEIGTLPIRQ
jgi:thiol-disulfide isomerase/thioredoxin